MTTEAGLTQQIKDAARAEGFDLAGVASINPPDDSGHLEAWLARGYHATMRWMERQAAARLDPGILVPGAQSILVVAKNYYTPEQHDTSPELGKISRYAWGDDYHTLIGKQLKRLYGEIQRLAPGAEGRWYADTGPVNEKYWAVRAGIGWQGKHTNVIARDLGSWLFLGVIILNVKLTPDNPVRDLCGSCTACLDACPTQAFPQPYVIDSRRCISYLTIEHKGPLDPDLIPQMQNWVFGCDICQDVCPWNNFAQPTEENGFKPRQENRAPVLEQLSELTEDDFRRRYAGSPVKRARYEGIVRNAHAALQTPQVHQPRDDMP